MSTVLHDDELPIDDTLVRSLIARDLPDHSSLPLCRLGASGSTNLLYRLGEDLLVRLPRQPGSGDSIAKERRWSPLMATNLPVAVPEVVFVGRPGFGYPEPWSVMRWIDGVHPRSVGPDEPASAERSRMARELADVVAALSAIAVPDAARTDPTLRWYRGRPLSDFDADARRNIEICRSMPELDLDLDAATRIWDDALTLPGATAQPGVTAEDRWYHGDLVAENLLLDDAGSLAAVLDFGALSIGDPTVDLHGAWEILDAPAREVLRDRLGVDEATWLRGRAWALGLALGTFGYYGATMPGRCRDRLAMARNVLADAAAHG